MPQLLSVIFSFYPLWLALFGSGRVFPVPRQQSSRGALDWTVLQGGLDLLCVPLEVLRLNVPVLSAETQVEEVTETLSTPTCLHCSKLHVLNYSAHIEGKQQLEPNPQLESSRCSVSLKRRETILGQYLPVDVGVADAAREVLGAAAWRPSVEEGLHSRTWRGSCGRWRTFLVLLVFVVHQQWIPKVNSCTCLNSDTFFS